MLEADERVKLEDGRVLFTAQQITTFAMPLCMPIRSKTCPFQLHAVLYIRRTTLMKHKLYLSYKIWCVSAPESKYIVSKQYLEWINCNCKMCNIVSNQIWCVPALESKHTASKQRLEWANCKCKMHIVASCCCCNFGVFNFFLMLTQKTVPYDFSYSTQSLLPWGNNF